MKCNAFILLILIVSFSYGQKDTSTPNLHNAFTERLGNFTIELLYKTARAQNNDENIVMSPLTVWTVLSVISEGAVGRTLHQLNEALRRNDNETQEIRIAFQKVSEWLSAHTNTITLEKLNAVFVNDNKSIERDFREVARTYYDTSVVLLNYSHGPDKLAETVNSGISKFTRGKIDNLVDPSFFSDGDILVTSALYFKGQWAAPFNKSSTSKQAFYDSAGNKIGEVNMMYNRHTYPFANIKELKARLIEIPYGVEDRLSMLIMLPYHNVSLSDTFKNFLNVPLDRIYEELRIAREDYAEDEVDLFLPRFKIESNIVLNDILKKDFGIYDLFYESVAKLHNLARGPSLYVSRVVHKAEIEVTEEGTEAAAVTVAELANRIGISQFVANKPFSYVIVEKVTNSIVYGGFYKTPSLY